MSVTTKRAAEVLGMAVTFNGCGRCTSEELREAVRAAIDALREKAEREDQKPLTLEDLLQMDEEVVWFEVIDANDPTVPIESEWRQVILPTWKRAVWFWSFGNECEHEPKMENYGKTWICYRYKPKEVQK